jgi:hypothetical protein
VHSNFNAKYELGKGFIFIKPQLKQLKIRTSLPQYLKLVAGEKAAKQYCPSMIKKLIGFAQLAEKYPKLLSCRVGVRRFLHSYKQLADYLNANPTILESW